MNPKKSEQSSLIETEKSSPLQKWIEKARNFLKTGDTTSALQVLAEIPTELNETIELKTQPENSSLWQEIRKALDLNTDQLSRSQKRQKEILTKAQEIIGKRQQEWQERRLANQDRYTSDKKEKAEEYYQSYLEQETLKQKAQRFLLVNKLRLLGISNPDQLLSQWEKEIVYDELYFSRKLTDYSKEQIQKKLQKLSEKVTEKDVVRNIKKVKNFEVLSERFSQITGKELKYDAIQTQDENLVELYQTLSSFDQEQWSFLQELFQKYPFIEIPIRNSLAQNDTVKFMRLSTMILEKQLPNTVEKVLESTKIITTLTDDQYGRRHPLISIGSLDVLLENNEYLENEAKLFQALAADEVRLSSLAVDRALDKFSQLEKEGKLSALVRLVEQGWKFPKYTSWLEGYSLRNENEGNPSKAIAFSQENSPETLDFLYLLDEIFPESNVVNILDQKTMELCASNTQQTLFREICDLLAHSQSLPEDRRESVQKCLRLQSGLGIQVNMSNILEEYSLIQSEEKGSLESTFYEWLKKLQTERVSTYRIEEVLLACKEKINIALETENRLSTEAYAEMYDAAKSFPLNDNYDNREEYVFRFTMEPGLCPTQWLPLAEFYQTHSSLRHALEKSILGRHEEWSNYFNENGTPKSALYERILVIDQGYVLKSLMTDELIATFDEEKQKFWKFWQRLSYELQAKVSQKLDEAGSVSPEFTAQVEQLISLLERIQQSPSRELRKFQDPILSQLMDTENPQEKLEQVIDIFERNNLPDVGKIFQVFEILHRGKDVRGQSGMEKKIEHQGSVAQLSPTLLASGERRKYDIIYKDLLNIHIRSNNPSLRSFLLTIKQGERLLPLLEKDDETNLSEQEQQQLYQWLNKISTAFGITLVGKNDSDMLPRSAALSERFQQLKLKLNLEKDQTLSDRVVEMFARPLGFSTVDEVLKTMDDSLQSASQRNKDYYQENPRYQVNEGDLIKGFGKEYLGSILFNGATAPEYLGEHSSEDRTPFDTDTSRIAQEDLTNGIGSAVENSLAKGYTAPDGLLMVFRNRGQFVETSPDSEKMLDPNKYEMFWSRYADSIDSTAKRHYGVRTGLPSSEIDALIAMPDLAKNTAELHRLKFQIALSTIFIPIVDSETGNYLFTPEEFERMQVDKTKLQANLGETYTPDLVLNSLKESSYLKELYEGPAYVNEGYSLERHTKMVLNQYDQYFAGQEKQKILSDEQFRLLLALHDVGKPIAFQVTGGTEAQHEYTNKMLPQILIGMGWEQRSVDIVIAVANQDIIGKYIQGKNPLNETIQDLTFLSEDLNLPKSDLFDLLTVYYMADAGSYTLDAGAEEESPLDSVFSFTQATTENQATMSFTEVFQDKYTELQRTFLQQ